MPMLSSFGGASFRGFNPGGSSELYLFTTFTFTNCGITGQTGPTLAQMKTAYSATSWTQDSSFFNLGSYQGYQKWTVPATGIYRITAIGARGGHTTNYGVSYGGRGARVVTEVALVAGEYITIVVGQAGQNASYGGGGGGASFVVKSNGTALAVAGAGGGAYTSNDYRTGYSDASTTTTAKGASGGSSTLGGSGGGGLLSNGQAGYSGTTGGIGFQAGCTGGATSYSGYAGYGSFGGGGGGEWNYHGSAGAGGGYSGGSTGTSGNGGLAGANASGGGGSYASGSNTVITAVTGTEHGSVTILRLS